MPEETTLSTASRRTPWNKGKLIGAKPPLRTNQIWSIRTRLMVEGRTRDLAMFNLAIDSKLRGCDVVASKSRTSHRTATQLSERLSGKGRRGVRLSSS